MKKDYKVVNATSQDMSSCIGEYLRSQKLDVSDIIVEQVLINYFKRKRELLLGNDRVYEVGIGTVYAGTRQLPSRLGDITAFTRYELESQFKRDLIENLSDDIEVLD